VTIEEIEKFYYHLFTFKCKVPNGGSCTGNHQCPYNHKCIDKKCLGDTNALCVKDAHCKTGLKCNQ